jgi:hypothetical protein
MPPAKKPTSKASEDKSEIAAELIEAAGTTPPDAAPVETVPAILPDSDPVDASPAVPADSHLNVEKNFNFHEVEPHDEEDVAAALQRETQDGKGDDEVPESDFDSFATDGVQKGELSDDEIAVQVLRGDWGSGEEMRKNLTSKGYNPTAVQTIVNHRIASGAPSAYKLTDREIATSVIRGEWGPSPEEASRRLEAAYGPRRKAIEIEVTKQLGG